MKEVVLSKKYKIYKGVYIGDYSIEEFLKYVELNDKLVYHTNNDSVWIEIETQCFNSINNQVINQIEKISNKKFENYSKHNWVYTQTKGYNKEWMHQHLQVHPPGRSNILTDYTFTFYLQIPPDITGDEGCIVFEDENKIKHKFLPQVGDIFIFPADIRHTAIPTPNSEIKRIVFAGSFCIDVWNQNKIDKIIL